jgi:UDP-glucose 4-epimerase
MLPEPHSPYAITKLDGEYYCQMFHRAGRLNTASLRFFNVFGPRQDPQSAYAAAVPIFMQKAFADEPITIFGDGEQTRDFVHVKDIAAALAHVAMRPDLNGTFNVGYGTSMTVNVPAMSNTPALPSPNCWLPASNTLVPSSKASSKPSRSSANPGRAWRPAAP